MQKYSPGTYFDNVKRWGDKVVTNTLFNMLNSYYIATLLDVSIVDVNLVENIIFYVARSIADNKIFDVYSPMKTFFYYIYFSIERMDGLNSICEETLSIVNILVMIHIIYNH